jgi:aldose 1-epimerase
MSMTTIRALLIGAAGLGLASADSGSRFRAAAFGRTPQGESVDLYTLENGAVEAAITNYGATLVRLSAPDRNGKTADVLLGFDTLAGYLGEHPYFGSTVGRYANRIAKGRFSLGGVEYTLARNDGENHLHGGVRSFGRVLWKGRDASDAAGPAVELSYVSRDGEEGYPGELSAKVTYRLSAAGELRIDYEATTTRETVVNLTNHAYFNLAAAGDVLGHELWIDADRFTPVDAGLIPTGELRGVAGTPFDFRQPAPIGARIDQQDEQLKLGRGYDHNFVLNGSGGAAPRAVARVREPGSGRVLQVLTTEPGLQLYSGNFLDGSVKGKGGTAYERRSGFCLETQHYPDSPNKPAFPSTVLKPGGRYRSTTVYAVSLEAAR